jgi:two-component system sensor histidine kinase BaeS
MRSISARVVLLTAVVALAGFLLTTLAFTRALGSSNVEQAAQTLASDADVLAGRLSSLRRVDVRALPRYQALVTRGFVIEVVAPGDTPTQAPFTAADVAAASADQAAVERQDGGRDWLVVGRTTDDGRAVLIADRVATATRLTPAQRRRALLGGLIGLAGGMAAGLAVSASISRPLRRLAAAARRLSAGERQVAVPAGGPTEVADVARALGALSSALVTSEQRQRQFLLAVSHELRTPLTAVTGYAEALVDGAVPAGQVPHAAGVIAQEAARLQRRVEDLMALARLEAEDFRLTSAPTDVGALVRAAGTAFAPRALTARVRLSVDVPAEGGPVVTTDGEWVRQIVDALVDNALKVLPPDAPLVLACRPTASGGVRVEVRDGGPGLAPEDLAVAFERGRLTERYRGSRKVGSGVGLALVGELARRLDGLAEATAASEGGVCFAVTLPARPPPPPPPPRADHARQR